MSSDPSLRIPCATLGQCESCFTRLIRTPYRIKDVMGLVQQSRYCPKMRFLQWTFMYRNSGEE